MRAELEPYEPLPEGLKRFSPRRLMVYVLLAVVAVAVVRAGSGKEALEVDGSCTDPGFAFDRSAVRQERLVTWSVAGLTGAQVIVTADSASADEGQVQPPVTLTDCKATGRFRVTLDEGNHVLRVFLREPDGTTRAVGTHPLEVDPAG